ncbi:leucine-rich repeat and immunoglobulin-like domain containing-NOGO receptor-interacting protein 4 [Haliotis rufescens]|uniref:leucine-rich repeat and immunoglobulin-like domain containing-NOGO receptor-interacting protein 4 n=1 Tax=Haliotis rufescens TaxID=6454 RepID=UPI00201F2E06|nr:leucine-rich repeat and immunoglobulin-like domain containing-NOGO receptor-interacting protein 4 [Haliotis rufescens]
MVSVIVLIQLLVQLSTVMLAQDTCPLSCHCGKKRGPDNKTVTVIRCSTGVVPDLSPLKLDPHPKELTLDAYRHDNTLDIRKNVFQSGLKIKRLVIRGGPKMTLQDAAFVRLDDSLGSLRVGNEVKFNTTLTFLRGLSGLVQLELRNNKQYWTRSTGSHVVTLFHDLGLYELQHLDMSACFIYKMSVDVFRGVESITSLDLSGNRLSDVPRALNSLTHLQKLDLSFNHIKSLQSGAFSKLNKLHSLLLVGNEFGELVPDTFSGLENSLLTLDLQLTGQKVIPTRALRRLKMLKNLNISENPFTSMLADSFSGEYCLHRLDIHYTQVEFHANMFDSQKDCLHELSLYKTKLTYIPRGILASLSKLRRLEFHGADIDILKNNSLSGINAKSIDLSYLPLSEIEPGAFSGLNVPVNVTIVGTSLTSLDFVLGYKPGTFQKLEIEGSIICDCDLLKPLRELGCALIGSCSREHNISVMNLRNDEFRNYLSEKCSVELFAPVCLSNIVHNNYCCVFILLLMGLILIEFNI